VPELGFLGGPLKPEDPCNNPVSHNKVNREVHWEGGLVIKTGTHVDVGRDLASRRRAFLWECERENLFSFS